MFQQVQLAPRDPILGLTEAYKSDSNPQKINLGVGIYQDALGKTPTLGAVALAEQQLVESGPSLTYLPIPGLASYCDAVQKLLFGAEHEVIASGRARVAQTPGGTGALRVTADFLAKNFPTATVWMTDPTWANHPNIFQAAGVAVEKFPYFDKQTGGLAFDNMLAALTKIPTGDAVLLHGCCHNPTGADPTLEQWGQIADLVAERGLLPIIDFAYQGFATGIEEDAAGLRAMARPGQELIVCSSFSKNFGLYCERVGAVTFVAADADQATVVESQMKRTIRANYSNPPAHGARLVATILADANLCEQWQGEVAAMRSRINGTRKLLVEKLAEKIAAAGGAERDFSFIQNQRGMFSFSGLTKEQVHALRDQYAIYIVDSGRINVAGINEKNVDRLTEAIAAVL